MNFQSEKCPKLPWMVDFHSTEKGKILNSQFKAAFASTNLEYMSFLCPKSKPSLCRATQLICTITPFTECKTLEDLMANGMSVARLKMTNFTLEKATEAISRLRAVCESYSKKIGRIYPLAIALEIKGPEIHTGHLADPKKKGIQLEKGKFTSLTTDPAYEEYVNEDMIFVDYQKINEIVHPGDKVILDNGSVTLSAIEVAESIIRCIIERTGMLISSASVTIPGALIELPHISSSDKDCLKFAAEQRIDVVFISSVVNAACMNEVKNLLQEEAQYILVYAKIENLQAVECIDEIIKASDGIFIDFEKIMVEVPREKVFLVQKSLLAKCNLESKPVICTIQLSDNRTIAKSEVCDIANAIIEGTDALLIQAESSNPNVLKSVSMICKEAEPSIHLRHQFYELVHNNVGPLEPIYSLSISAIEASLKSSAAAIIVLTTSGRSAKIVSSFRPRCPIIAVTRHARVARQLKVFRSIDPLIYVKPLQGTWEMDVAARVQLGMTYGKYKGYIKMGDTVIILTGSKPTAGFTNTMRVVYASEFDALPKECRQS